MRIDRPDAVAALWGAAEATVFFIVPDVLLSWIALRSLPGGLRACLFALAGALVGGVGTWCWARYDVDTVRAVLAALPAIDPAMIDEVRNQLAARGPTALFLGPLTGTPYKIYAAESAGAGIGLATFFAVSIPARLSRFVLVTLLAGAASRLAQRRWTLRGARGLHVAFWIAFYIWYFWAMGR